MKTKNVLLLHPPWGILESFQIMTWLLMSSLPSQALEKWDTSFCGCRWILRVCSTRKVSDAIQTFCFCWKIQHQKIWIIQNEHHCVFRSCQFHFGGDWIKFFSLHSECSLRKSRVCVCVCLCACRVLWCVAYCAHFSPKMLLRMSPANTTWFHLNLSVWCQPCFCVHAQNSN